MRKRLAIGALTAVLGASLLGASGASAATEFGSTCVGNELTSEFTLATLAGPGPLPATAPSAGVITKLKMNLGIPLPFAVPTNISVLHPLGGKSYSVSGQAAVTANIGLTTTDVRLPVQGGDILGLRGVPFIYEGSPVPSLSVYCKEPGDGSVIAGTPSAGGPGSTIVFGEEGEGRVPIAAVLEPDADNDGFGDETQDKCPQNAAVQAPCPVIPPVTLSATSVAKKGLVTVLITSNVQAPVTVTGAVKLSKKGEPTKLNGGSQLVPPATIAKFTLLFPQALKAKLKLRSPKQSLPLAVTATATNSAGVASASNLKVKLKGQAKPKHKR